MEVQISMLRVRKSVILDDKNDIRCNNSYRLRSVRQER
jgi:hypothetical protein